MPVVRGRSDKIRRHEQGRPRLSKFTLALDNCCNYLGTLVSSCETGLLLITSERWLELSVRPPYYLVARDIQEYEARTEYCGRYIAVIELQPRFFIS